MHHGVRACAGKRRLDLLAVRQIALDESCPRIYSAAMTFAEIIEDGGFMAFIEKQFGADAPDIARPQRREFSSREVPACLSPVSKESVSGYVFFYC
jgi:hypothetical protein